MELDGVTQVLVFGDVATGWFVIQEREVEEGGWWSSVMEGERPSCPQLVTFPPTCHAPSQPPPAQNGHRVKPNQLVMLQTYGEAWL